MHSAIPSQAVPSAQTGERPSPALFLQTINGYQQTAALKAAIELELFTAIGEGKQTPEAIALRCQAAVRGVRVLCDYMTVLGFLTKQDGKYGLTRDTAGLLDRRSPGYIGGAVGFLTHPMMAERFAEVAAAVRKGGTVSEGQGVMEPEHAIWQQFARAMAPLMSLQAELIAQLLEARQAPKWKVLDIAAGHGMFGITLARHNRQAEIVAVDWAPVLEVAREHAQQAGVSGRYRSLPGSAFEVEFGEGYDLVLLTNILHHFDAATCEGLLRKVHRALAPGGRAVTLEFVPDEDRLTPPPAAMFSLTMLVGTPGGSTYTFSELRGMLRNAGFQRNELREIPPAFQRVVISYK
jgi:SAM-dependent methyltransferase